MLKNPIISVIIPFYNRETKLPDAVRSVLAQTYSSFELLLIDDGSTDASLSLVNALNDDRIRIIRHERNLGAAAARNTGVREAANPIVAFLDSDDIWHPDKLEKHVTFHLASGAAATCTSFEMVRENGQRSVRHLDEGADWNEAFLYGCHVGPGSTLMADRAVFERIGYLDESLKRLEDWDWLLRLVRTERFKALDAILSEVRVSGYPRYEPVAQAIANLRQKHEEYLSTNSKNLGIFLSGLQIECAYISLHNKKYLQMFTHLFKAAFASPGAFVQSITRILRGRTDKQPNNCKRLLFVLDQLGFGGVERNTIRICNHLSEEGHDVTLLCLTVPGALEESVSPRVKVVYLNALRSRYGFIKLLGHLWRNRYDAVISAKEYNNVLVLLASILSFQRSKIITTTRTHLSSELEKNRARSFAFAVYMARHLYPLAFKRIAVSKGVADNIPVALGRPDMEVDVIYNPAAEPDKFLLDPPSPHPFFLENVPVLVGCGRLCVQKDFALLIDAVAYLQKTIPIRLLIVGDGELREELLAQIDRLGLQDNVQLIGFTHRPEDYMYHARLFVLSSQWEGFGNVLVEALSVGCPIVSMDCPSGPSEILEDGKWGRLVSERSPQALAQAIKLSLDEAKPDRAVLRARAADFTPAKIAADYLALLDD